MTEKSISQSEALSKINPLKNLPILEANRTYAYFLVLRTDAGDIVIETPWTLFHQGKTYLDIKTENYDQLQPKANKLLKEKITGIELDPEKNVSTITFSNDYVLKIYHEDESSVWSVKLAHQKSWIEYRSDNQFYISE